MNYYLLFKSLHLIAVISWMAGLLYLPRIFVYHVENMEKKDATEIFEIMERKLYFYIMRPAMIATWLFGIILVYINVYLHTAMTLTLMGGGSPNELFIGIGMWLGIIMWFNVWFVIWPNQKKALGIVEADAEVKAASARTAMLFSRTNTLLSIPMLLTMVAAQNLY